MPRAISRRRFAAFAALAAMPMRSIAQTLQQKAEGDPVTKMMPYLLFEGSCRQAMEFYHSVFGGELKMMKVSDSVAKDRFPAFQQEKVLNAHLESAFVTISASDWLMPNRTPAHGNTVCLYLTGGTPAELKALFTKLADGADVTDPMKEVFFGYYGALNDRFGVRWMFQTNA